MRPDRPSSTARLIARSLLLSARDPARRALVAAGDVEPLTRLLGPGGWARCPDFAWRLVDRFALPGIFLHYLARKRWLERAVLARLRADDEQVVVLGAGFDLLAWRLHRDWPRVRFCECDHPATQRPKSAVLTPGANLVFAPVDLGRDHPGPLVDRQRRTCFVAEGLLMYFSPERVVALLQELARPGATLVFTFMEPGADGRAAFRGGGAWIDAWLRLVGEPFAWSTPRARLGSFLHHAGWRLESSAGAAELRAEILAPAGLAHEPLAEGECLALATALP